MSSHVRDQILWSKSLLDTLKRTCWRLNDQELSRDDGFRVAFAYTLWCSITWDIGKATGLDREYSRANISRWICQLQREDVSSLAERQKQVLSFVRSIASKQYWTFTRKRIAWRALIPDVNDPLFFLTPLLYKWFKGGEERVFGLVNTWLQYTSRLTLHDTQSVEADNVDKYLAFEANLRSRTYPEDLMLQLRESIHELFGELRVAGQAPHFSSGATYEVPRRGGTAKKLASPIPWGAHQFLQYHGFVAIDEFISGNSPHGSAKLQLVPKGINKKRVISMEPSWNNYCQHAIFDAFDKWFHEHPNCRVDLHRQETNRWLALRGSRDRSFSTIDLSDASDSVTLTLVKFCFKGLPIYPDLIRTRSCYIDLGAYRDGQVLEIEKFAPMGSAVTFPMECAVFSGICHMAENRLRRPIVYQVYGDDIVVESAAADEVIDLLGKLGFHVNTEKSFCATRFTESCGVEALNGFDVTPLRIPRQFDPWRLLHDRLPSVYVGALDFINRHFETVFVSTRRFLIDVLLEYYPETYFTHRDGEYGIKTWASDLNFHLRSRGPFSKRRPTGPNYQRTEWRCLVPHSTIERASDDIRYQLVLDAYRRTDRPLLNELTVVEEKGGRTTTSLVKRWYPGWVNQQLRGVLEVLRGVRGMR